jgi:formate-dependent nitrite reductase membrane component NrfD
MRSICSVFCFLALFFFVFYLTQPQRYQPEFNEDLMWALVKTILLCILAYGLYRLIIVLVVISVPEIRDFILGWLANVSDPAETLLVLSILCLIICVVCRTRPARQSNSQ